MTWVELGTLVGITSRYKQAFLPSADSLFAPGDGEPYLEALAFELRPNGYFWSELRGQDVVPVTPQIHRLDHKAPLVIEAAERVAYSYS